MSRVSKNPVVVPGGVEVKLGADQVVNVKGALGALSYSYAGSGVDVKLEDGSLVCQAQNESKHAHAMSGTVRSLLNNMVTGVSKGFEKKLLLVGVGYRAQAQGDKLNLSLGFSHPVLYQLPAGVKAETPSPTEILIKGADKQQVGHVAAEIRAYRRPEPYKGKGVRYADETVVMKETKKK